MSFAEGTMAASTLMLCGLVWVVQVVHYPAFRFVEGPAFTRFHAFHSRRITLLVAVLMPVEALSSAYVAVRSPGPAALAGLGLVALVWASTALLQVPAHRRVARGYDARVHARLVATNWIRTAAWTARAALMAAWL